MGKIVQGSLRNVAVQSAACVDKRLLELFVHQGVEDRFFKISQLATSPNAARVVVCPANLFGPTVIILG